MILLRCSTRAWVHCPGPFAADALHRHMSIPPIQSEVFIKGITPSGRPFRPSDWAERLAGVMAQFRPGGGGNRPGGHIGYSPWCVPTSMDGVKCVVFNRALRDYEPMAWDFVMNFAKDNELQVVEACLLPQEPTEPPVPPAPSTGQPGAA